MQDRHNMTNMKMYLLLPLSNCNISDYLELIRPFEIILNQKISYQIEYFVNYLASVLYDIYIDRLLD